MSKSARGHESSIHESSIHGSNTHRQLLQVRLLERLVGRYRLRHRHRHHHGPAAARPSPETRCPCEHGCPKERHVNSVSPTELVGNPRYSNVIHPVINRATVCSVNTSTDGETVSLPVTSYVTHTRPSPLLPAKLAGFFLPPCARAVWCARCQPSWGIPIGAPTSSQTAQTHSGVGPTWHSQVSARTRSMVRTRTSGASEPSGMVGDIFGEIIRLTVDSPDVRPGCN